MLTKDQKERYSRQIILKEIGAFGQKKLLESKVLVVGAGGLGSPVIFELACAGVGTVGIADFDYVELNNLNRQFLHFVRDLGKPKVLSAKEKVHLLDPGIKVIEHSERINEDNIEKTIAGYDVIADCSDNFDTKYTLLMTLVSK